MFILSKVYFIVLQRQLILKSVLSYIKTNRAKIIYVTIVTKPQSPSEMTTVSFNIDTCLACSVTVPDVVSDNYDICRKVFTSKTKNLQ